MLQKYVEKIKKLKPFYEKNTIHNIFSWKELESLLNLRPFVNDKRFIILGEDRISWKNEEWLTDNSCIPPSLIKEQIIKNNCYLRDCSRVNNKINMICEELENITGYSTDAHIFFSISGDENKGFGCHRDLSHNFIVQIEGQTNFKVWNVLLENIGKCEIPIEIPIIDIVMNPGDVIFIPAKYVHEAVSKTPRLSISFPSAYFSNNPFPQERIWINVKELIPDSSAGRASDC